MRLNVAAFYNRIYGMQRQVTSVDAAGGAIQVTANTADATIQGLETEVLAAVGSSVTISGFVGFTDGAYDEVRHDLNGDSSTAGDTVARFEPWSNEIDDAVPAGVCNESHCVPASRQLRTRAWSIWKTCRNRTNSPSRSSRIWKLGLTAFTRCARG